MSFYPNFCRPYQLLKAVGAKSVKPFQNKNSRKLSKVTTLTHLYKIFCFCFCM